jgi:hypothetical protein
MKHEAKHRALISVLAEYRTRLLYHAANFEDERVARPLRSAARHLAGAIKTLQDQVGKPGRQSVKAKSARA